MSNVLTERRFPKRDLLGTLERLLEIQATDEHRALDRGSDVIARTLSADKVNTFIFEPETSSLVARGTTDSEMSRKQRQLGLDRLPLVNRGRTVKVYQTGEPYLHGRLEEDPEELPGLTRGLNVRSKMAVVLLVDGARRGTLEACSAQPDFFGEEDLRFLAAAGRWMGAVLHRAELTASIRATALEEGRRVAAEDLFTVLAHDLRNFLSPIQGRAMLLRDRALREHRTADVRDCEAVEKSVNRLARLINNLLDVGRLERGMFALNLQPVDLSSLVRQVATLLRTSSVHVLQRMPPALVVQADPDRVLQAVENLLANAIKHSPHGGTVTLELTAQERLDGPWAILEVRDQGPGVAAELLPHIFRRYVAGKGSTGLGLGLYLAHSIAVAHGGTLEVFSRPAEETRFVLSLPVGGTNPGC